MFTEFPHLWREYLLEDKRLIGASAVASMLFAVSLAMISLLFNHSQQLLLGDPGAQPLLVILLVPAGFFFLGSLAATAKYLQSRSGETLALRVQRKLQTQLFGKGLSLRESDRRQYDTAYITTRISSDGVVVFEMVKKLVLVMRELVTFSILSVVLLYFDALSFVLALFLLGIFAWPTLRISDFFQRTASSLQQNLGDINRFVIEILEGRQMIKAYGLKDEFFEKARDVFQRRYKTSQKKAHYRAIHAPLLLLSGFASISLLMGIAFWRIHMGTLEVRNFVSFLLTFSMFMNYSRSLGASSLLIQEGLSAFTRMRQLLELPGARKRASSGKAQRPAPLFTKPPEIVFSQVSFAYNKGQPILEDLTFSIKPGQMVAVIGNSGSGKSTLFSLLLRLYQTDKGRIEIDSKPLDTLQEERWLASLGFIGQHLVVLQDSIINNIRYGNLQADKERVRKAAHNAGCLDFIESLPQGWETMLDVGGENLSQGQRQRLALARVFVRDPSILLLDEPTSALDVAAERHIMSVIMRLKGKTSIIMAAHRLSTAAIADHILVMERGRIVRQGPPDAILGLGAGVISALYPEASTGVPP